MHTVLCVLNNPTHSTEQLQGQCSLQPLFFGGGSGLFLEIVMSSEDIKVDDNDL